MHKKLAERPGKGILGSTLSGDFPRIYRLSNNGIVV